jgi:hypothetical protein
MRILQSLLTLVATLSITACTTVQMFKSEVNASYCKPFEYATLAFPINANGTLDKANAGVGCGGNITDAEQTATNYCETHYGKGRKCIIAVHYTRSENKFEDVMQQNFAEIRRQQSEQYYENLKDRCVQIGYQRGTTQNSDCVMKLVQQNAQMQQQQNAINQQQQDRALMQMMQGLQMMSPPASPTVPIQTTCNKSGTFVNCTTR